MFCVSSAICPPTDRKVLVKKSKSLKTYGYMADSIFTILKYETFLKWRTFENEVSVFKIFFVGFWAISFVKKNNI